MEWRAILNSFVGLVFISVSAVVTIYSIVLIVRGLKKARIKNDERKMSSLKCPKCRRYDVEYREGFFRCPWKDCGWKSREYKDPGMTKEEEKAADRLYKNLIKKG